MPNNTTDKMTHPTTDVPNQANAAPASTTAGPGKVSNEETLSIFWPRKRFSKASANYHNWHEAASQLAQFCDNWYLQRFSSRIGSVHGNDPVVEPFHGAIFSHGGPTIRGPENSGVWLEGGWPSLDNVIEECLNSWDKGKNLEFTITAKRCDEAGNLSTGSDPTWTCTYQFCEKPQANDEGTAATVETAQDSSSPAPESTTDGVSHTV